MANYDRNNNNDYGRRPENRFDRYATERYSGDRSNDRNRMNDNRQDNDRYNQRNDSERGTGNWRDDELRSRGEDDRGFFERAAETVSSWFGGDEPRDDNDRRENWRDEQRERRYSTEGRGSRTDWNTTFDTRHGSNMDRDRYNDRTEMREEWRNEPSTVGWQGGRNENRYENRNNENRRDFSNGRRELPERFSQNQPDGREAGRDYYNRLNDELRSGGSFSGSNYNTQSSPYASNQNSSRSNYGSYGRGGSNYGSSNSSRSGSSWSNQSGTFGDNSGTYGSASLGQYSGKGPKGYRRNDERVKEDVCETLTRNAMIDASDIDITVVEGVVTLTGTVPDRQMKRMSEDEIEMLPGVKEVNNQLRINRESDTHGSQSSSMSAGSTSNQSSMNASSANGSSANGSSANGSSASASPANGSSRSEASRSDSASSNTAGSSNSSKKSSGVS